MEQRKHKRELEQMKAQARGYEQGRGKRLLNPGSFCYRRRTAETSKINAI
jgi:hypothetical protein